MNEENSDKKNVEWYKLPIVWILIAIAIGYFLINLPTWQQKALQRQTQEQMQNYVKQLLETSPSSTNNQ